MLLLIVFVVVLIVFLCLVDKVTQPSCKNIWTAITAAGLSISIVGILIVGISTLYNQAFKEYNYHKMIATRAELVYRLEETEDSYDYGLFKDIIKFNNILYEHKTYSNNLWCGLMYNDKIAQEIEYIIIYNDSLQVGS